MNVSFFASSSVSCFYLGPYDFVPGCLLC